MEGSIVLSAKDRKRLIQWYRKASDPHMRLRAHILLLLAEGYTWAVIAAVLFCSTRTIARWKERFEQEGLGALLGRPKGQASAWPAWGRVIVGWVLSKTPRDFGFFRSRWCCATIVVLLLELHQVPVSRETVRRWLHREQIVWRRPRPVLGPEDPQRPEKLRRLRRLLATLPEDEIAVFQDEVDVNLNPDIGSMWMRRGQQATVETPGNNQKRYLAGSLNWRTGQLIQTFGPRRNSALFIAHLRDVKRALHRYRVIHVICDNGSFHDSKAVRAFLAECRGKIVVHFLPSYSPDLNPIERIWWHLREEITRNHRCQTMAELTDLVIAWIQNKKRFPVERSAYMKKTSTKTRRHSLSPGRGAI